MNKTFQSFLLLLSSSFLLSSCNSGNGGSSSLVSEESISISQTVLTLEAYESATLSYTLTGKEGTPTWASSDPSIANVDSSGKVTGVKEGNCTITVSVGNLSSSCAVTVTSISQAPRIVLGEPSVSLDKGNTYVIDAYAIYKNEARNDALEISLKGGSASGVASATYANKKITISGLEYGQTDFIVHANVLGVLVTSTLHINVVNADLILKLGNIAPVDGEYSLELGMYKVDDDGLPTEFAPEVIFTDKEQPAAYALTYTSGDESIASWDDSHKILAKGVGETSLKITCEQFRLSVEIKVSVVKGAYDVTLKNINEKGESATEKVGAKKLPKTTPSVEGKKFVGWFDEEGNQVTSVIEDMTLIAHYSVEHEYSYNTVLKKFTTDDSDYTQPEGTTWKYKTRPGDRENDIKLGYYPAGIDGTQCFLYPDDATGNVVAGLGLPAYDFSTSPTVRFNFGFSDTANTVTLNGVSVGDDTKVQRFTNYTVTVRGKQMSVYNKASDATTDITLTDDVYYGRKGLEITAKGIGWRWLMVTPFVSLDVDYVAGSETIEDSLPEDPVIGYQDQIDAYQGLRQFYSEAEDTLFPVSEKMKAWIDAYKVYTLSDYTDNAGVTVTGNLSADADTYQNAVDSSKAAMYNCPTFTGDSKSFIANCLDLTSSFASLTFPAVDFSAYKTVYFTFGMAGNIGRYEDRHFFLGDAPSSMDKASEAENYIGKAATPAQGSWDTASDITATISNGTITFNGTSIENKTFALSDSIYKGEEGLKLSFGNLCWEYFVASPFYGYKI